jgi:hypothetical protein
MTISDLGVINAEVKVAEADVLRLVAGQPAVVTLDALLGQRSSGRMVEIGAGALPVTEPAPWRAMLEAEREQSLASTARSSAPSPKSRCGVLFTW